MPFTLLKIARVLPLFFKVHLLLHASSFAGNGFEDLSLDPARPWNGVSEETLTQAAGDRASKRRRPLSPLGSDQGDYDPLPPHPPPGSSSAAPARKKKKSSRAKVDVAAMMQSLVQALALQQRNDSSLLPTRKTATWQRRCQRKPHSHRCLPSLRWPRTWPSPSLRTKLFLFQEDALRPSQRFPGRQRKHLILKKSPFLTC